MTLKATDIFTPADFPGHSYVERPERRLEIKLKEALSTPGEVISLSGPSKSGKTVLVEKVVGQDNLIVVTGSGITGPDSLWERTLDWMGAPISETETEEKVTGTKAGIATSASAGVLGFASGKVAASGEASAQNKTAGSKTHQRRGLPQVVKDIANSDYVLLIDDYHYMEREAQASVAKEIKQAARLGIKIVTASVPHRADDVVRAIPELRGRVRVVDLDYWTPTELRRIPAIGFPLLNATIDDGSIAKFVVEASGSPQLMQAMCLQACFSLELREAKQVPANFVLDEKRRKEILEDTSGKTDFSSLVRNMHVGPKPRGNERKTFAFSDGTTGDVYRAVLLALATSPACLSFPYNDLLKRVQKVCLDSSPQGGSITQACIQIGEFADAMYPNQRVVEWDQDNSVVEIVDPYFLFYLRWSNRLSALGVTV